MDAHVLLTITYLTGIIVPAKGLLALLAPVGAIVGLILLSRPWAEYVKLGTALTTKTSLPARLIKPERFSALFAFLICRFRFSGSMLTSIRAVLTRSLCFKNTGRSFCNYFKGIVAIFRGTDLGNSGLHPRGIHTLRRAKLVLFSLCPKFNPTMLTDFFHASSLSHFVENVKYRRIL